MLYKNMETPRLTRITSEQSKTHTIFWMKHRICMYDVLIAENRARCIQTARFCKDSKITLGLRKPAGAVVSFARSCYENFILYRDLQQLLIKEIKEKFGEDF